VGCAGITILIFVLLPFFLLLVFLNIIPVSFQKLGVTPQIALGILIVTIIGSMINIPVSRRRIVDQRPRLSFARFFFYTPPQVSEQIVMVNVGGAIIPTVFALYLLLRAPLAQTLIVTAAVTLTARLLAKPVVGMGIVMPAWIPPLLSAGLAMLLVRENPAPVAYIGGTMGTLIGADLLNWHNFKKLGAHVVSIGGAGVFDGIFLSGIIAALIA
jgi:uncharacterized membrane protein